MMAALVAATSARIDHLESKQIWDWIVRRIWRVVVVAANPFAIKLYKTTTRVCEVAWRIG
jgi:hypothetical protein